MDFSENIECMMEKVKTFDVGDYLMLYNLYAEDKTMNPLRRLIASSGIMSIISVKLEVASQLCNPERKFGDYFGLIYDLNETDNSTADDLEDLQLDYCQRKHLIDNHFVDSYMSQIAVNPKSIEVVGIPCHKLFFESYEEDMTTLKDQLMTAAGSTKKHGRCMAKAVRKGEFVENMLKVWMLGEINITDDQKESEKKKFVTFMTDLYKNTLKCAEPEEE